MSRRVAAGRPPRQTPYKRTYTGGRGVWVARYFDLDGKSRYAKPRWNGGKSTFARKGDALRRATPSARPTPHEFRHSYVTHLRAAGIDDADLARIAGHTVDTMIPVYTHALERSHEAIRKVIG